MEIRKHPLFLSSGLSLFFLYIFPEHVRQLPMLKFPYTTKGKKEMKVYATMQYSSFFANTGGHEIEPKIMVSP